MENILDQNNIDLPSPPNDVEEFLGEIPLLYSSSSAYLYKILNPQRSIQ